MICEQCGSDILVHGDCLNCNPPLVRAIPLAELLEIVAAERTRLACQAEAAGAEALQPLASDQLVTTR